MNGWLRMVLVGGAVAGNASGWFGGFPAAVAHPWHRHDAEERGEGSMPDADPAPAAEPRAPPSPRFILTGAEGRSTPAEIDIATAFAAFEQRKAIVTRRDDRWFYVESNGIPDHPLMVGIRTWQQQVPLPQPYTGANAWQIPLHPVRARQPAMTKDRFLRGAIAVAVNGIPIFNPLNNRGEDALAIGELDDYGGHCGRADDYHYHVAPVHLEEVVGKGMPVAYALDGYPVFGSTEPDGGPLRPLDALGGHDDGAGGYHYHAMPTYPYLIGGFRGEVVERDGQVDPQPQARPIRPALGPLRGARITDFETVSVETRKLVYEIGGRRGSVEYTVAENGSATFRFTDPAGRTTTESHAPRNRGRPDGPGSGRGPRSGGGPPRPGEERTRPPPGQRPPPPERKPPQAAGRSVRIAARDIGVTSPAIASDGLLPTEFTCDGAGVSPPVAWQAGPPGTASYAVVLWHETPDGVKSYWIVYDIPASVTQLPRGSRSIGLLGVNDKGRLEYDPMCSKGPGRKEYHLTVYALAERPSLRPAAATRAGLLGAIAEVALAEGTLSFSYSRSTQDVR
jgi:phosphatidylethanolamine-binding protein (PEBP) family uncharacterized protein